MQNDRKTNLLTKLFERANFLISKLKEWKKIATFFRKAVQKKFFLFLLQFDLVVGRHKERFPLLLWLSVRRKTAAKKGERERKKKRKKQQQ